VANTTTDRVLIVVGTRPIRVPGVAGRAGLHAAVANAIADATGRRLRNLPMSPPNVLAELDRRDPEPQRLAAE
jgi:CO/xanthine dehydrogenase Mo-binding subunit